MTVYPDWLMCAARAVLGVIESDFGQSGEDVRLEAIRCELAAAYRRGQNANPFDCASILGDPREHRISMRFETREQYEAACVVLDMADQPEQR